MRQERLSGTRVREATIGRVPSIRSRIILPVAFFAVAFAIDMATGQRYSSVWGSAAILASIVYLFPAIRLPLAALGSYTAVWIAFNLVRAFADDAGVAVGGVDTVAGWERRVFGGTLPSVTLQETFFDPSDPGLLDGLLSLVHGSFFIVPFLMTAIIWWKRPSLFQVWSAGTSITFALGLVGFLLLPTSPPWLADPDDITRVTTTVLADVFGRSPAEPGDGFSFEPNHLAAMPSVHVAATVLVFMTARRFGVVAGVIGGVYALLMSIAVVYLGEHYILDAVRGWAIGLAGWITATRMTRTRRTGTTG